MTMTVTENAADEEAEEVPPYLAFFKLGGAPAMDGLADVLLCADDDGEDDKDDGGVQVVQAVDPVVIVATLQTCVGRKTTQYAVKPVQHRGDDVSYRRNE